MEVCVSVEPERECVCERAELLVSELSCHCCYELLLDPTTLPCGHSFCRHCLASWWASGRRSDCPECRSLWSGVPRVNILLRDAVEKLFPADVSRRRQDVLREPWIRQVLQAFQQQSGRGARQNININIHFNNNIIVRQFLAGVWMTLTCVTVVLLLYRAFTSDSTYQALLNKPLSRWSPHDVTLWVEHMGLWTNQYKETFRKEQINGRSLSALSDGDLSTAPFLIEDQTHRRLFLEELQRLKELRVTPHTLWEYKEVNTGRTLFLLVGLRCCPRLTLLYLLLFDFNDVFLPFIHTSCPADTPQQDWPGWRQWAEFLLMYFLLPYQLLASFAWQWMSVHFWTATVVIIHCALLTALDVCFYWSMWRRGAVRLIPWTVCVHVLAAVMNSCVFVLLWPIMPQFIINCEFYITLYFGIFLTAVLVKQTLPNINRR